jgi:hypothetical protein
MVARIEGKKMIILNEQKEILSKAVGNLKIVADCL